ERSSSSAALPDYSMVMLDCGLNPQASYANLIFLSPRCGHPSDGSAQCPLTAQSGHRLVRCTCPLLTQRGHRHSSADTFSQQQLLKLIQTTRNKSPLCSLPLRAQNWSATSCVN